jgi:cell division protein FtsL
VWIGIVAFALIGIVTLQLGLLKLNSGIGRALEREASLQRENAALSVENSELASGSRVETQAEQLGMRLAAVGGLQFLGSHPGSDVSRAAAALQAAPAHQAAAAQAQTTAPSSEERSGASTEAGSEAPATEGAPASTSTGESSAAPGTGASSGAPAEHTTPSATPEAAGETRSEPVPAGVGGGAAAPGG